MTVGSTSMSNLPAITPKEFRHIAQGCRASRLPWVSIRERLVPHRGSVIVASRMTQPFQGRPRMLIATQGSPPARATLGYVTQSLRDKG